MGTIIDTASKDDSNEDTRDLLLLLQRKLSDIPNGHIPVLTLADIVKQTPKTLLLPNIPPDLQLAFFLTERTLINSSHGLAIKDENLQHIDVTRAIFYYRLDEVHQFQRYHDSHRWNIAIFLAILTLPRTSSEPWCPGVVHFPPAARRFVIAYLAAVLEHHNTPEVFEQRELFVRLWKNTRYEFYTFGSGQKKLLKVEIKRLNIEWEKVLDRVKEEMGEDNYNRRVAKFVGVLMPGRKDQRARPKAQVSETKNEDAKMEGDRSGLPEGTLFDALKEPLGAGGEITQPDPHLSQVVKLRDAIPAVKGCQPRVILSHLLQVFPDPEKEEDCLGGVKMDLVSRPKMMKVGVHDTGPAAPA